MKSRIRLININWFWCKNIIRIHKKSNRSERKNQFEFTKNLSAALELILILDKTWYWKRGHCINYNSVVKAADGSLSSKIINELFNEIENNKKKHNITSSIKLPH